MLRSLDTTAVAASDPRARRATVRIIAMCLGTLLLGLALTTVGTWWLHREARLSAEDDFLRHADRLERDVARRISQPLFGINGARGMFAAHGNVNRIAFRRYVEARDLPGEFPGIRGFGFIERVPRAELARFVEREQRDAAADFAVRTSGNADDLFVIKYIEPLANNRPAWGYDIGSEPVRREAAERAMRTGEPALTGPVALMQDNRRGAGWLMLAPVYIGGLRPETVAARESALIGFVYAPIIAAEVLTGAIAVADAHVDFELFDGATPEASRLLFDADDHLKTDARARMSATGRMFETRRGLLIGGRLLTLRISSTPQFGASVDTTPAWILATAGTLLSLTLAWGVWLLASGRAAALARARAMTADVQRMARVLERTSNAVFGADRDMRITWINEGFTRTTGYAAHEAIGRTATELLSHPRTDPATLEVMRQAIAKVESCRVEILCRHKDGTDFWVETEVQPTRDANGQLNGFMEIALDITARKVAEQRLRANEAFLQQAERLASVGGWSVDLETGTLKVTQQLNRLFDLPPDARPSIEEFIGHFDGWARELIEQTTADCIKTGVPWDLELPLVTAGGRSIWVRTVGQVEREGSRSVGLTGILQDVTQRRAMETELRLANTRLQAVLQNLPCGLSVFDGGLRLVAHNAKFRSLLSFPDELFGNEVVQFEDLIRFNGERGEYGTVDVEARVQEIIDNARTPVAHRFERRRPNGTVLEVRGAPMPGGGFVTTYVDITDRKRAEEALRASEDLMRVVTDNIPGRVAYWDSELRCKFANRTALNGFKRSLTDTLGHTAQEILGPERFAALEAPMRAALRGEPQHFERNETSQDGAPTTVLVHYIPDVQRDSVVGFFVLTLDITEIKRARDLAVQASQAKGQFLANMSHEIRTPMNAILGMLALLHNTSLDARQLDYVVKTEGAARSLLGLLNDILDFSKVEAGKMTLDPRPFSLDALLRDLSVILSANAGAKDVELLYDVGADVPSQLQGDDMRLRQILINLGGNALKFTERGEVVIGVHVMARDADAVTLRFSVRDTGIGIAPEAQAQIFEGFSQAEASTTRRFGGTGLGLAICQRLVRLMGGQLGLDSAPGQGSRFHFDIRLPVLAAAAAPDAPPLRALFVDDNAIARAVLLAQARTLGWTVDAVDSGPAALERLQQGSHYDAVFLDWRMPGMDGWDTSQRIRALPGGRDTPMVVMVTAHGREMLARRSAQEQARLNGFLVKPVTASMLLDAVLEARRDPAAAPAVRNAPAAGGRPLQGLRLLVVEDNRNNQQVAQELLLSRGAQVELAANGREGVDKVAAADPPFDLVLMDVQMPELDGYGATREIRERLGLRWLPIVAMTANALASDRDACLAAGMNDHVGKPFDIAELVSVILRHSGRTPAAADPGAAVGAVPTAAAHTPVTEVEPMPDLDLEGALERLGGDFSFYEDIYPAFRSDVQAQVQGLSAQLEAGQRDDARRAAHTVKGLAATMGANALAALAARAERGLAPSADAPSPDESQAAVQALQAGLEPALQAIEQAMARWRGTDTAPTGGADAAPSAPAGAAELLAALATALDQADMAALELHERLCSAHGARFGTRLDALNRAMAALDFAAAAGAVRALQVEPEQA